MSGLVIAARDWRDDAACRAHDPELFFPVGTPGPMADQIEEAKQVCAGCPVQDACLDWALRYRQDAGVCGGLTEQERRALGTPSAAPAALVLCDSGRHLKDGPGRCPKCRTEYQRERQRTRVRDQSARAAARRAGKPRKPRVRTKGIAA